MYDATAVEKYKYVSVPQIYFYLPPMISISMIDSSFELITKNLNYFWLQLKFADTISLKKKWKINMYSYYQEQIQDYFTIVIMIFNALLMMFDFGNSIINIKT